jgi:hypothetical protein
MSHDELISRLDAVITMAGTTDPFGLIDLALVALRSDINAQKQVQEAEDENIEAAYKDWEERNGYPAVCANANY